jgi:hypothetical protein
MTCQAAIDDSGSEPDSYIFILAGFIASHGRWAKFADEWQRLLDGPPKLDYFKMKEAERLHEQFSRDRGWTEQKRDSLLVDLAHVIERNMEVRIHAGMLHSHFNTYLRSLPVPGRNFASDGPYVLLAMNLIASACLDGPSFRLEGPCDFIFDEQDGPSAEIMHWWPTMRPQMKRRGHKEFSDFLGSPPIWRDEKKFFPLQAADLYAWHVRRYRADNRVLIVPPRAPLRIISQMPMIRRFFEEDEIIRLRQYLIKMGSRFTAANPLIPLMQMPPTKRERQKERRRRKLVEDTYKPFDPS